MLDRLVYPGNSISKGIGGLAVAFVALSFTPYLALPIGSNTSVSLAAIAGALLTIRLFRSPVLLILILATCMLPFLASLVRQFFINTDVNSNAYFTSIFTTLTFFGAASALQILRERMVPLISISISLSSAIAIVQKYVYLDRGIVPWLEVYNVPGYASVALNAETIGLYIRRPFGLFPEPSFLAGTLTLACAALIGLTNLYGLKLRLLHWVSIFLAAFTIYISDSGSGIVCIVVLGVALLIPFIKHNRAALLLLPVVISFTLWLGLSIASSRQDRVNTSWNDRYASIVGGANLWTADLVNFLVGVGRGMIPTYFRNGDISFADMTIYSIIPDIYSVLGREILENGFLFGLPIVVWMSCLILRQGQRHISFMGVLFLVAWIVVAGLTISYETAAWIWLLPGIFLGQEISTHSSQFGMRTEGLDSPSLARRR